MGRRAVLGVLFALTSFFVGVTPPAHAAVFFAAECLMTLDVTFTPELKVTPQPGTVTFESTGATCAGTSILGAAAIEDGTVSGSISCGLIAATAAGSATLHYPPSPSGTFTPAIVGNIALLDLVMLPKSALIVGNGTFTVPSVDGNCLNGVAGMTMTGVVTFSDPAL